MNPGSSRRFQFPPSASHVPKAFVEPPRWSSPQLDAARQHATADFVKDRLAEGASQYRPVFEECLAEVENLFAATDNLRALASAHALSKSPRLVTPARYLGGPPISADDLDIIADGKVANARRLDSRLAAAAASVIEAALDRRRFPWLFVTPRRKPSAAELRLALEWTAGLWAAQRVATKRRGESSARQEAAVNAVLKECKFDLVRIGAIDVTAESLHTGQYCRETNVIGTKCDVPVKLRDGRLLLVECKVSNSSLNSVKRLIREIGGKARIWRSGFGDRAITAAVLSGVFKLRHLEEAQNQHGVVLFWERDLRPLRSFLLKAVP